jgi:alanyl-tRNA synthetase
LAKEVRDLKKQLASGGGTRGGDTSAERLLESATAVDGVSVITAEVPSSDANQMRQLIDQLRKTASPVAVMLGSREADKVTLVAGISRDLEARGINAGNWIRTAAEVIGGRGGGKPDMAQAGGKHPEKLNVALQEGKQAIQQMLTKK